MATSRGKLITALSAGLCLFSVTAWAAPADTDDNSQSEDRMTVHGQRGHLPPGYEEAPSMELNHGPDPDHLEHVHRDSVTGTDLSRFGSATRAAASTVMASLAIPPAMAGSLRAEMKKPLPA